MRAGSFAALLPAFLLSAALTLPQAAGAADYLRGSQYGDGPASYGASTPTTDWSGFYAGGFAGYSNVNFDSKKTPGALIANFLRQTTVENQMHVSSMLNIPSKSTSKESFGGFVGYNTQWDDVVLGVEADYTYIGAKTVASDQLGRSMTLSDGYLATAWVSGKASTKLEQLGTIRGRAGYVMGNFMPYVTGGFAFGTAKLDSSAAVYVQQTDPDPTDQRVLPTLTTSSDSLRGSRSSATVYGGVVGGGVEAAFGSLLVRGEVLYARLGSQGRASVDYTTARVGAGVKF